MTAPTSLTAHIQDGQHCKVIFRDGTIIEGDASIDLEDRLRLGPVLLNSTLGDHPDLVRVVYPEAPKTPRQAVGSDPDPGQLTCEDVERILTEAGRIKTVDIIIRR